MNILLLVIPAKAGFSIAEWLVIQFLSLLRNRDEKQSRWIPAFAGMTACSEVP
jgi:hypothetical protein